MRRALISITAASFLMSCIASANSNTTCRCFPGDSCWPNSDEWDIFNATVKGNLIRTVPLASSCHEAAYDAVVCKSLQDGWTLPQTHYTSPDTIMTPFFANMSCDPFTPKDAQCVIGTYPQYSVRVEDASQVQHAIRFATERNIRFVIRNTGHDYNGKSTGAGSLAVWTHNLKSLTLRDWNGPTYQGKAIKMGAGVQGFEVMKFASDNHLSAVGGECDTVGIAGGYTQGAGHSALSSKYGLGADQVLEAEVVDGNGTYRIASRETNSDLFWAIRGGGGGTYGVVLSMTVKAHEDIPVTGGNFSFTSEGLTRDQFYDAVNTYHASLPEIVDSGVMTVYYVTNASFTINPLTGPGITSEQMIELLQPLISKLESFNKTYDMNVITHSGYLDHFYSFFGLITVGVAQYGGWLVPRSVVQNNNEALTEAYRAISDAGGTFTGVALNVSQAVAGESSTDNAVNPAWRECLIDTVLTSPWSFDPSDWPKMLEYQKLMTDVLLPKLQALSPDSGAYINEPDWRDPQFKKHFYGENYDRLLAIKQKYDPTHLFYGPTTVGSDLWYEDEDKRLCKALT